MKQGDKTVNLLAFLTPESRAEIEALLRDEQVELPAAVARLGERDRHERAILAPPRDGGYPTSQLDAQGRRR